jgi:hypothetical protein
VQLENHIAGTIVLRDILSVVEKQDILTHDLLRQGTTMWEKIVGKMDKRALVRAKASFNFLC